MARTLDMTPDIVYTVSINEKREDEQMTEWISTDEASTLTGYPKEYIRKLAGYNRIAYKKVGWAKLIDKESLLEYKRKQDEKKALRTANQ